MNGFFAMIYAEGLVTCFYIIYAEVTNCTNHWFHFIIPQTQHGPFLSNTDNE